MSDYVEVTLTAYELVGGPDRNCYSCSWEREKTCRKPLRESESAWKWKSGDRIELRGGGARGSHEEHKGGDGVEQEVCQRLGTPGFQFEQKWISFLSDWL